MQTTARQRVHEKWLLELTALPTAAGRENRVIDWVTNWVKKRPKLILRRDKGNNLVIRIKGKRTRRPILVTAHLDHPAFVVREVVDQAGF